MNLKYNILIGGYFYNAAPIDINSKEIKTSLERKKNHSREFRVLAILTVIKYPSLKPSFSALQSNF